MDKSLGETVGKGLGEALLRTLLGEGENAAYEREIIERLSRIEGKVDATLRLLGQIPELTQARMEQSLARSSMKELHGLMTELKSVLTLPLASREIYVLQSANAVLRGGERLLREGQDWYMTGVYAMSAALPAYARLIDRNNEHSNALAVWASEYRGLLEPWVDPKVNGSLANVKPTREDQKTEAEDAVTDALHKHFLLCVNGPFFHAGPSGGASPFWLGSTALLQGQDQEGNWNRHVHHFNRHPVGGDSPPDTAFLGVPGMHIMSWWSPAPRNESPEQAFARMLVKANIHGERKLKHPARIKECDVALDSVQNLLKCCKSLERLKT